MREHASHRRSGSRWLPLLACLAGAAGSTSLSAAEPVAGDLEAGLVAEYFSLKESPKDFPKFGPDVKPTLVRVDKTLKFEEVDGEFYETRFDENFYARWTGVIRIAKPGKYTFFTNSDDGSRIFIGDKQVVENGGVHASAEKSGTIDLTAGDHRLRVEFFEASGGAGMVASWEGPDIKKEPISEKVLLHSKASESIPWDKVAWEKLPKGKGGAAKGPSKPARAESIDIGALFCGTVGGPGDNMTPKGMIVRLNKEKTANVLFDTELLRVTATWTGGYFGHMRGRDGLEGLNKVEGISAYTTKKNSPGWAKGGDFKDPRAKNVGSLPRDWAKYKGLYVNGEQIVFSYTVGNAAVLESHAQTGEGMTIFARTLQIEKADAPLALLACDQDKAKGRVAALDSGAGEATSGPAAKSVALLETDTDVTATALVGSDTATFEVEGERVHVKLPAASTKIKLLQWKGPKADLPKFLAQVKSAAAPEDLSKIAASGGPARWTQPVTVKGKLGEGEGAYVVDTITVPYENPWQSYMRITGVDFFADGRAAVSTIDGDVWIVSGIDDKLETITWKRYATGLFQALGLKVVDEKVYTLGRDQITRFHDLNNDGEADFYECFNNDGMTGTVYHEFALDLQTDSKGNFYYMKGSNLGSGGTPHAGTMLRVSKDGEKLDVYSYGYRAPNGMSVGPNDEITTSDNQGNWTPLCPVNLVEKDSFQGYILDAFPFSKDGKRADPICWMPYGADNSGGGQVWSTGDKWGPFKNRLMHLSYGKCLLYLISYEKVGGTVQGGAFKFPLTFISGIMRGRVNPKDGQVYLVGMKGWQTSANLDGVFQRVRYTGKPVHMPTEIKVTKTGVDITFTNPLDPESAKDVDVWSCEVFNVKRSKDYGSKEYKVNIPADATPASDKKDEKPGEKKDEKKPDPKKLEGRDPWTVKSAKLSADGKTVSLEIPEIKPVTNMVIKFKLQAADGTKFANEIYNTINVMP